MILQVLAVCLSGLYTEQIYHSYPQKVKKIQMKTQNQPAAAQIFCHKYYEQMMIFAMIYSARKSPKDHLENANPKGCVFFKHLNT